MKRRRFIEVSAVAAAVLPTIRLTSAADGEVQVLGRPSMLTRIADHRTVRSIGESYRRATPEEDDLTFLVRVLRSARAESNLRTHLDALVDRDFREGLTVRVDGWILSRTEARQCALYSLM